MNMSQQALELHEKLRGKITLNSKVPVQNHYDLSLIYTPGVAQPCMEISRDREQVYRYTGKSNLVAIVSDGTAVLGLGDIGPEAAIPVMEGKAVLFKEFAGINAFPICLATREVEALVATIKYLEPVFGGINLEDIAAPRCFEIEKRLQKELGIPVFHDDQHGTAVVTAAGLINALKLTGREFANTRFVVNGPGAAGTAITKMLLLLGAHDIMVCNRKGILRPGDKTLRLHEQELAALTNQEEKAGTLAQALEGADVFIGVSAPDVVTTGMIRSMNRDSIVFALANPIPEIMPAPAYQGGARIVATGRSDFPNQINNVLAFPGIFRGVLDGRIPRIDENIKRAAAYAIANIIDSKALREDYLIPDPFDRRVVPAVAQAVMAAAGNP